MRLPITLTSYTRHFSLILLALISTTVPLRAAAGEARSDLAVVRANWEKWETGAAGDSIVAKAHTLAAAQQPDGCWANVDYTDQHVSEWPAALHLDNLNMLATATYVLRHRGSVDAKLDHAAVNALHCWLAKDLHNPNWWWNEIGAPKAIGRAALLLQLSLTPDDIAKVTMVLQRSVWTKWTGQNLVWGVDIQMMRGLLNGDDALVQQAFARMYQEVRIAPLWLPNGKPGEGIENDGSFHQHGAQLYSGGYGFAFANDVGRELVLSWNTTFQAPPEVVEVFSHFMLDGQQWMMHGGIFEFIARGREITRPGETKIAHTNAGFLHVVQSLAALPLPRQTEFQHFAASLSSADGTHEVTGNRAFWDSDLMEHKRPGYTASVRMLSTRSKNEETLNGEGTRSVHLADGANLLYKNGQEYAGVFPVWDWVQIPGTTALQWISPGGVPLTGEKQSIGQMGHSAFAGEVSDGTYGAAAMQLERGPLTAKKAWFFFDHLYVALGADIHLADAPDVPKVSVVTTIEQSRADSGPVQQNHAGHRLLLANNDVGYVIALTPDDGSKVLVHSGPQTGRWSDIGTGPETPVILPVFRLAIDHGVKPTHGAYEYTVLPQGGMKAAEAEAAASTVQVLANTANVQAVTSKDGTLIMAVFYTAGSVKTPAGMLRVSAPALVLLHRAADVISVTASNPLGAALSLDVTLNKNVTTFQLPGEMDAGRSVTKVLSH